MPKRVLLEDIISKANCIHNNKYDYSLIVYKNVHSKVDIICPIHGIFNQSITAHIHSGNGCPSCRLTKITETNLKKHGVKWNSQIPSKIEKSKQTNLERYGHENIAQGIKKEKVTKTNLERYGGHPRKNKKVQEKQKQTNLERYGVEYPAQSLVIQEKIKQTNLERYGVEYPGQSLDIQNKIKQSIVNKYGVNHPLQSLDIKNQRTQHNIKKYGVKNPSQLSIVDILPLLEDKDWLFNQYITQNKTALQISKELNVPDVTIRTYLILNEITIKYGYLTSYKAVQWFNNLSISSLLYEYKIPETRYKADGYCPETNTVYEFYGDYWHGNPAIYAPEDINLTNGKTMGELYQKTIEREQQIKSMGYNLVVMWENEFNNYETRNS